MELFFRKYFWTLNLAFLALAAFLVARTANVFVAGAIAPDADDAAMAPAKGGRAAPVRFGAAAIHIEQAAKMFGVEVPKPEVEEAPAVAAAFDPSGEPVKSSLRASLIGTMVANRPEWSLATLRDDSSSDVGVYMPGDRFMTAEVDSIERLRVIVRNEGRREYIALDDGTPKPAPSAPPPPAVATGPSEPSTAGIEKIDDNNYNITRDLIDQQLANLSQLSTQARIVPSFKDGVANGFKLFSIRPGSLYSQIGIQNGDVIKRINGYEINSPDKALEVYSKLKESAKVEIEIERRGSPMKKSYTIR